MPYVESPVGWNPTTWEELVDKWEQFKERSVPDWDYYQYAQEPTQESEPKNYVSTPEIASTFLDFLDPAGLGGFMPGMEFSVRPGKYAEAWSKMLPRLEEIVGSIEKLWPGYGKYTKELPTMLEKSRLTQQGLYREGPEIAELFYGGSMPKTVEFAIHEGQHHVQKSLAELRELARLQAKDYLGKDTLRFLTTNKPGFGKRAAKSLQQWGKELQARTVSDLLTGERFNRYTTEGRMVGDTRMNWSEIYKDILSSDLPADRSKYWLERARTELGDVTTRKAKKATPGMEVLQQHDETMQYFKETGDTDVHSMKFKLWKARKRNEQFDELIKKAKKVE